LLIKLVNKSTYLKIYERKKIEEKAAAHGLDAQAQVQGKENKKSLKMELFAINHSLKNE